MARCLLLGSGLLGCAAGVLLPHVTIRGVAGQNESGRRQPSSGVWFPPANRAGSAHRMDAQGLEAVVAKFSGSQAPVTAAAVSAQLRRLGSSRHSQAAPTAVEQVLRSPSKQRQKGAFLRPDMGHGGVIFPELDRWRSPIRPP